MAWLAWPGAGYIKALRARSVLFLHNNELSQDVSSERTVFRSLGGNVIVMCNCNVILMCNCVINKILSWQNDRVCVFCKSLKLIQ